jgi:hypothetical protein
MNTAGPRGCSGFFRAFGCHVTRYLRYKFGISLGDSAPPMVKRERYLLLGIPNKPSAAPS